jgi:hypothetical protein
MAPPFLVGAIQPSFDYTVIAPSGGYTFPGLNVLVSSAAAAIGNVEEGLKL